MGILEHQAAVAQSEQIRLQALGPLTVQNQPSAGPPALPVAPLSQVAVNNITIAHYRRLRASAIANGITPAPYIAALQSLGTGGS
jgi:hypothetical protein